MSRKMEAVASALELTQNTFDEKWEVGGQMSEIRCQKPEGKKVIAEEEGS